jgi:hypothetical protein
MARCASAMVPMLSWLSSRSSGRHRVSAVSCKPSHCRQSCAPLGPSNGRNSAGPRRIASWVVATAERYAASPSSGPVCARPKPPWRMRRVSCSVGGPFVRACPMMAKAQSTALLSARTTPGLTCSHVQPRGRCATRFWRLP